VKDNRLDLDRFQFRNPEDAESGLQVYCNGCENTVTTAEDGDSLDTIVRMCDKHVCIYATDTGTWLAGHMGWHNTYRVVERAAEYGMELSDDDRKAIDQYRESNGLDMDAWETVGGQGGLSDQATEYLNQHAPDGHRFVWDAGELMLLTEEDADQFEY